MVLFERSTRPSLLWHIDFVELNSLVVQVAWTTASLEAAPGSKIRALLWYQVSLELLAGSEGCLPTLSFKRGVEAVMQGESDCDTVEKANMWSHNFLAMIKQLRYAIPPHSEMDGTMFEAKS